MKIQLHDLTKPLGEAEIDDARGSAEYVWIPEYSVDRIRVFKWIPSRNTGETRTYHEVSAVKATRVGMGVPGDGRTKESEYASDEGFGDLPGLDG